MNRLRAVRCSPADKSSPADRSSPADKGSRADKGGISFRAMLTAAAIVAVAAFLFWPEAARQPTEGQVAETTEPALPQELWTCSMHPQVLAEAPGRCPQCGMNLVPIAVPETASAEPASPEPARIKFWRAPMDPNFVSDKPGKSPMGMDLIPVYEDAAPSGNSSGNSGEITISPAVIQNMGVRTATVDLVALIRDVRTVGTVDYDERLVRDVTTRFEGWIADLFADYTGQFIEKGMPLFSVYSRELYSTQEEYILALRNRGRVDGEVMPQAARDMSELIGAARTRLELFGVGPDEIREIGRRGSPTRNVTINSPHTGIIVEKHVREGMKTTPGMKLYTIADLSRVWVIVDIFESELPFVRIGQDATMKLSYLPEQKFEGKVVYVFPFVNPKSRTVSVRLEFDNQHHLLKPGMFADVLLAGRAGGNGLSVPRAAVLDTGLRKVVFEALSGGRFRPHDVEVGRQLANDRVEILEGLEEGDEIVVSGQFLLDSESKLREAVLKMIEARPANKARGAGDAPVHTGSSGGSADQEHVHHEHAQPEHAAHVGDDVQNALATRPEAGSRPDLAQAAAAILPAYLELHRVLAADLYVDVENAVARFAEAVGKVVGKVVGNVANVGNVGNVAPEPGHSSLPAPILNRVREALVHMQGRQIDVVRAQFTDISAALIDLVSLVGAERMQPPLHAFDCPMAGAQWLQEGVRAENPYYGFAMHSCGDSVDLSAVVPSEVVPSAIVPSEVAK